jgi:mRNA interferase RelE/StbE
VPARQYRVEVSASAARDLTAFAKRPPAGDVVQRLDTAIVSLKEDPRPAGAKKLVSGGDGWRLRVGDYRILYDVNDKNELVTIGRVLHRSESYRD